MEIVNRDIYPSDEFVGAYPDLEFLIRNPPVAGAFADAERAARFWKQLHNGAGFVSLACILVVMWTLDYILTLGHLRAPPPWLDAVSAAIGGVGLLAQLVLILGRLKPRWLLSRFVAERLRCVKFQAFVFAAERCEADAANPAAEAFTREAIANLAQEMMGGRAAMIRFEPGEVSFGRGEREGRVDRRFLEVAQTVYERLRLEVQLQQFEAQEIATREADRLPRTVAEVSFVAGALIACLDVILAAFGVSPGEKHPVIAHSLNFATWAFFATSAVVAVYQRGAARQASAERYARYANQIERIRSRYPSETTEGFAEAVREMETVALEELHEFCRDSDQASFVF
jgi:hypothetical protein